MCFRLIHVSVLMTLTLMAATEGKDNSKAKRVCGFTEVLIDTYMCFGNVASYFEDGNITGGKLNEIITGYCASLIFRPGLECFLQKTTHCYNRLEIVNAFNDKSKLCKAANLLVKPYITMRRNKLLVSDECMKAMHIYFGRCRVLSMNDLSVEDGTTEPMTDNFTAKLLNTAKEVNLFVNCLLDSNFTIQMLRQTACSRFEPRDAILTMIIDLTFHENLAMTVDKSVIETVMSLGNVHQDVHLAELLSGKL